MNWTDSESAIHAIQKHREGKTKMWQMRYRYILADINNAITERIKHGSTTVLEYIPSHVEEKRAGNPKVKSKMEKRLEEITRAYPGMLQTIIEGNENADKMAKMALEKEERNKTYPTREETYSLWKEDGSLLEGQIRREITQHLMKESTEQWKREIRENKRTKHLDWDKIDTKALAGLLGGRGNKEIRDMQENNPIIKFHVRATHQSLRTGCQHDQK